MNREHGTGQATWRIIAGGLILTLGLIHLMDNLNLVEPGPYATRLWPLMIVVIGLQLILVRRQTAGWASGIFWIATGALFLAATSGYLNVAVPRLIWPVMVIWFGLALALRLPQCSDREEQS